MSTQTELSLGSRCSCRAVSTRCSPMPAPTRPSATQALPRAGQGSRFHARAYEARSRAKGFDIEWHLTGVRWTNESIQPRPGGCQGSAGSTGGAALRWRRSGPWRHSSATGSATSGLAPPSAFTLGPPETVGKRPWIHDQPEQEREVASVLCGLVWCCPDRSRLQENRAQK